MDYRKTEEIMAWVADYERGDFSVNGDSMLSRRLADHIRKLDELHFRGKRMRYDGQKMYMTAGEREGNGFRIPEGAVVYGPYSTFPAGEYQAEFHLGGNSGSFTLCVESVDHGIIAQKDCHGLTSAVETVCFVLPARVENLELKLINRGPGVMLFHAVEVSLCVENAGGETEEVVWRRDREALAVFRAAQQEAESTLEPQRRAASCALPQNTRLRFFKRVIRKLIKPYIAFQILFNNAATAQGERLTRQMRRVSDLLESVFSRLGRHEKRLQALEQELTELRAVQTLQGGTLEHQAEEQKRCLDELRNSQDELQSRLNEDALWKEKEQAEREADNAIVWLKLQELEGREVGDSEARKEISHLWNKVAEFDANFRGSWKHDQDTNNNINSLWKEQSNLRREVFYELEHRLRGRVSEETVTEIVVKESVREKLESGAAIRLNLGSGNLAVEGYLSVDARDLASVDVVADVGALPFGEGEVDEIYSAHLIEHFTLPRLEKELLPHWFSKLKTGGVIRVVFPDLPAMIAAYSAGEMSFDELGEVIMGGQDYALDYHYAVHSVERVSALLERAGFKDIRVVAAGRKNGQCRESEITAAK